MQVQIDSFPRRRVPKAAEQITALVKTSRSIHEYAVHDVSVAGTTLDGGPRLPVRNVVQVVLRIPLYPEIRVSARVLRTTTLATGRTRVSLGFMHQSDRTTEDHIQAALLSELERSHSHGIIPDFS